MAQNDPHDVLLVLGYVPTEICFEKNSSGWLGWLLRRWWVIIRVFRQASLD